MNSPPAWQCYAQDFLTDVQEWDDAAVGIYFRLLNYQWINRDIPSTIQGIVTLCNSDEDTVEIFWNEYIKHKFILNDGGRMYNKRLENYWLHLKKNRVQASKGGKASAEKRRKNKQ